MVTPIAADLFDRFGPIPLWRIRIDPKPGTATEQDVIEIHDREKEVIQAVQTAIGAFTYEELSSTAGKNKVKLAVRKEINNFLNRVRVKRVLFKSVILKP